MSISFPCPSCKTTLTFAENLAGKTVKCKECSGPVTVKPAAAKAVAVAATPAKPAVKKVRAVVEDDEPVTPKKKPVARKDDDEDDAPRRKSGKKSRARDEEEEKPKKSMLIPIIAVGAVLILGGGVAAVVMGGGSKKDKEQAAATPTTKAETKIPPTTAPITPPTTKPDTPTSPVRPPVEPPPVKPVETPVFKPAITTKRPTRDNPDDEAKDKMMKASVYLEVEDAKGGGGSGSGWFGVEPNLIFTNAHVIGMDAPNSKPPTKITAWINAGQKGSQVKIPNAKLKLLAVDRDMDLAVLEVVNMTVPAPLMVRPSQGLGILEKLVALGYPGGRRLSRNSRSKDPPVVTVSQTQVQALPLDENGNIYSVQVQGGIVHGNSGGPLCDADGNCVGVAVRVDLDREGRFTNIAYGVPTEYVTGLLAGRIANVEYGQAYFKDGKVAVPVKVRCLDPRKRLQEVGLACWVGDDEMAFRPPGESLSPKPSDSGLQEVKLMYNASKQEASGELIFPLQQPGRAYWCQPYFANAISPKYFMGGNKIKLDGAPVEQVPADLIAKYRVGSKRTLTLGFTRNITELEEGDERERGERLLRDTTFKLNETVVKAPDAQSIAGLTYGFKSWDFKIITGDESSDVPKDVRRLLEGELQNTTLTAKATKLGVFTQLSFRPNNGIQPNPAVPQEILIALGNQAFEMIQKGSIALPGKKLSAGETWTASVPFSIKMRMEGRPPPKGPRPTPGTPPTPTGPTTFIKEYKAHEEVRYTYLGLRDHGGKKEIVVTIEGTVQPDKGAPAGSATGSVKGIVRIDESTGMVVDSEIKHEFEIDTSEKGIKKRISGIEDFKLSRGPAGN